MVRGEGCDRPRYFGSTNLGMRDKVLRVRELRLMVLVVEILGSCDEGLKVFWAEG